MEQRVDALLEGNLLESVEKKRLGGMGQQYLANREHALATDLVLQKITSSGGLKHFKTNPAVGRLTLDEVRFDVKLADLPQEIQEISEGFSHRSCVFNRATGLTRLEVNWGLPRPSFWPCSDMGSSGWQWKLKAFYRFGLRGGERFDPPHRTVRSREAALTEADGRFVKTEFSIVFSYLGGPWGSRGNLQMFRDAGKEMFRSFTWEFKLYRNCLYERLVRARYPHCLPAGFGTKEHMEDFWNGELQMDPIFTGIETSYSNSRWKSWNDNFDHYDVSLDLMLLIGLYILLTRGLFKELNGIRLLRSLVGPSFAAEGVALPDGFCEDITMKILKEESKALQGKRCSKGGGLLVLVEVLANTTSRKLATGLREVTGEMEDTSSLDRTKAKTRRGRMDFYVGMSTNATDVSLAKMWKKLHDPKFLERLQFLDRREVHGPNSLNEDRAVSKFVFELMIAITHRELDTAACYKERAADEPRGPPQR
jgi:hypothetical protein